MPIVFNTLKIPNLKVLTFKVGIYKNWRWWYTGVANAACKWYWWQWVANWEILITNRRWWWCFILQIFFVLWGDDLWWWEICCWRLFVAWTNIRHFYCTETLIIFYVGCCCSKIISFGKHIRVKRTNTGFDKSIYCIWHNCCFHVNFSKTVTGLPGLLFIHFSSDCLWYTLNGYIKLTSKGWILWVQCGGRQTMVTWFSRAFKITSKFLVWERWPSKINSSESLAEG